MHNLFKYGVAMPKVIFFFAGTGDDGRVYSAMTERQFQFKEDVIRVYIKGCQEKSVGNGVLFPDLEIAANNVRNAFEGNELDLKKLRENFGNGLHVIYDKISCEGKVKVDDITLEGFSRGAVTTFAAAKKLDDLNIPLHIIANQPVPGEVGIARRLYSRYGDLRSCRNIKTAHTFLASYNLEQGFAHNYFFRQMVAKFSTEVNAQHILFPHQNHLDWFTNSPISLHIKKLMIENGLVCSLDDGCTEIRTWYQYDRYSYFTPHEFMQTIYGADEAISKDPIFLDLLIENAKKLLAQSNIDAQGTIKSEQATAIILIANLSDEDMNSETKIRLYELVLKGSKRAEQFTKIINKVTEVCDYLPYVTVGDDPSKKSKLIKFHANNYKKSIFLDSFEFLSKDKSNAQDKKQFAENIYKAECVFRAQALGIERSIMRTILKLLTNFITHITGIALIVNTINKVKTGNWLLFQHNRSVNAVRDTRKVVLDEVDKFDSDQANVDDLSYKSSNL